MGLRVGGAQRGAERKVIGQLRGGRGEVVGGAVSLGGRVMVVGGKSCGLSRSHASRASPEGQPGHVHTPYSLLGRAGITIVADKTEKGGERSNKEKEKRNKKKRKDRNHRPDGEEEIRTIEEVQESARQASNWSRGKKSSTQE